jgi:hypothetical protein
MPGVSPLGVAANGTVMGVYSRLAGLRFGDRVISHLPSCSPSLHRVMLHGFIATTRALTSTGPLLPTVAGIARSFPSTGDTPPRAWAIGQAVSPAAVDVGSSSTSCARQTSLLTMLDLPTIPSPATSLPFRHGRFLTLLHRRDLPRLSHGQTQRIEGFAVAWSRVRAFLGASPTGLAESSSHRVTDWSFVSGCSPPFLTETQLPLSTTGWQR